MIDDPVGPHQAARTDFGATAYALLCTASVALTGIAVGAFIGLLIALFTGLTYLVC